MKANIVDMKGVKGADVASKPIPVSGDRTKTSDELKDIAAAQGGDGTGQTRPETSPTFPTNGAKDAEELDFDGAAQETASSMLTREPETEPEGMESD
jgi:hypothetical protein